MGFNEQIKTSIGYSGETAYANAVLAAYPNRLIVPASIIENRRDHIDLWVEGLGVDVKTRKNIGMLNFGREDYTVLEVIDVYGKYGWLYGKADIIAFEYKDSFIDIPRQKLVEYHLKHTRDEIVKDINLAVNKAYCRFGSKDLITVVPFQDILGFVTDVYKKSYANLLRGNK